MKCFLTTPVLAISLLLPALLTSCQAPPRLQGRTLFIDGVTVPRPAHGQVAANQPPVDDFSEWTGGGAGPQKIVIKIDEQAAYFYRGGQVVGKSKISSGMPTHPTPTGSFRLTMKDAGHHSSLYGDYVDRVTRDAVMKNIDVRKDKCPPGAVFDAANMFWFMQFAPATGMHAGYLPGYPASHGCVRMPEWMAKNFFENATEGMPVIVMD